MSLEEAVMRALQMFRTSLANPKPHSKPLVDAWVIALANDRITPEQVEQGTGKLLKTAKFFPTPSEMIEAIRGDVAGAEELAWQKVRKLISKIGTDATWYSTDLDPVTLWAVERMGLEVLGDMTDETRPFRRQEFGRLYRAGLSSGERCHKIAGWFERMNLTDGRELTPAMCGRVDLKHFPSLPESAPMLKIPMKVLE